MFSTGPVAAAGFSYGPVAGEWATLTKLVRNGFIGVVAVGYSLLYAADAEESGERRSVGLLWTQFPKFLVGFVVVAAVANLGFVSEAHLDLLSRAVDWLFLLAFAGLGFDIRVADMREAGLRPVAVTLVQLLAVSALALLVVRALF